MDEKQLQSQQALVTRVVSEIEVAARQELLLWAQQLVEIRASSLPAVVKARRALKASAKKEVVTATIKALYRTLKPYMDEVKRHGWDDRGVAGRFTLGGVVLGATVFSGQGAGLAALGSAIGLPLWFVLGTGGALLGTLVEELSKRAPLKTEYSVIDAERIEDQDEQGY